MLAPLFLSLIFALTAVSLLYIRGEQFRQKTVELETQLHDALRYVEEVDERQTAFHAELVEENRALRERLEGIDDLDAEKAKIKADLHAARFAGQQAQTAILAGKERGEAELAQLQSTVEAKRVEIGLLDEALIFQTFAVYTPKTDFALSQQYVDELNLLRSQQKAMIRSRVAVTCAVERAPKDPNASAKGGNRPADQTLKLLVRAFNGECDAAIARVRFDNVAIMERRIKKAFATLNSLARAHRCSIATPYLNLKLQELFLTHEYAQHLAAQEEEQTRLAAHLSETEAVRREREMLLQKAAHDETHWGQTLARARADVEMASPETAPLLRQHASEMEKRWKEATRAKERITAQLQQERAGYVYVLSNTGSFGENVYKIGTTQRLDPKMWLRELGEVAVPFPFDIHAIIYADDAQKLEEALHKTFAARSVNRVNTRRGFYRVTLAEIIAAVKYHYGEFEFAKQPEAKEYRQTLAIIGSGGEEEKRSGGVGV